MEAQETSSSVSQQQSTGGPKTQAVSLGGVSIGGPQFVVIAGPCSVESQAQVQQTAEAVQKSGAQVLRGGLFKLRTDPRSFQGMGREAFQWVQETKQLLKIPFISEITDPRQLGDLHPLVDAFQVGSRNMYNYELLKELGQCEKPVLLKRGFSGLIKEWLLAADYVVTHGNSQVLLCERGIRSFDQSTRNTFDLNAIAYIKQHSPLSGDCRSQSRHRYGITGTPHVLSRRRRGG